MLIMAACFELRFRTKRDEAPLMESTYGPCMLLNTQVAKLGSIAAMLKCRKPEPDPFSDRFSRIRDVLVKKLIRSRELNKGHTFGDNDVDQLIHAVVFILQNLPPTNTYYVGGLARPEIDIWMNEEYGRTSDSLHCAGDFLFIRTPDGSYRVRELEEVVIIAISALRMLGYKAMFAYFDLPSASIVTDRISQGKTPAIVVLDPFKGCSIGTFCLSFKHPPLNAIEIYPDSSVLSYLHTNAARNIFMKITDGIETIEEDNLTEGMYKISVLLRKALKIQPLAPWILALYDDILSFRDGILVEDLKAVLGNNDVLIELGRTAEEQKAVGRYGGRPS